ncbi:conserved membrane protein of unknown function (plasmid) [Rhodovastum atsumiense]|uniref:Conjugal transfer protein TraA n=1 Tax=Rhodovastum atsumiense TaxID=504468 RepID=A0A5M6IKX6_9PROT|nr:TraA family conjugative transfer protein [Rhodovastum atsumiense]KAA5608519.1 hypothetical protein F1189_28705 [Rhodovastum atsumiense]CAH2605797.1 conserved membrane protein of unknown function [Rhodovastum atsumiense]
MRHRNMVFGVSMLAALMLLLSTSHSDAGTGGAEFSAMWTQLQGWVEGTLGRVVTVAMVIVGIAIGIARQSLMAFATGVGGGLGLYATPAIVTNIFVATLPAAVSTGAPVVDLVRAARIIN